MDLLICIFGASLLMGIILDLMAVLMAWISPQRFSPLALAACGCTLIPLLYAVFWSDETPAIVPVFFSVPFGVAVTALVVSHLRAPAPLKLGVCAACGYDLRGTPGSVCPECGQAVKEAGREV